MIEIDTNKYKKLLENELKIVTDELKSVGHINPSNPADWEANPPKDKEDDADENITADNIEAYEDNSAILKELEIRFNEIKVALQKITDNKYGICEKCGKQIEIERLDANPAAVTCIADMKH
ncbi:MAG: TraR/DksA C4-type zinc finger protein [Patescibacteria group bacterium]|nr:TraR/DksA C4-type zinc finger protein [Patescibacteria group bacterium]